ncbi:MAG: ABC transporter ATP-binding protein [Algisphaera sp.]
MTTAPAPPGAMIHTSDLRVDYGDTTAVHALDLSIGQGEVYGLIGPNGAGKTSTIKVLATLLEPIYGEVFIGGHDVAVDPAAARAVLGYMPDLAPVYDELKVWEFLDVFARAHGLTGDARTRRVSEVLDAVSLESKRNAMAGSLSRGMTQRLVLAKTLLHKPKVMLLDEPASGLDPVARIELRDLLRRLSDEKYTVLISSHILTELSGFCTSVGIMEKGRMVVSGPIDELTKSADASREITIALLEPAMDFVAGVEQQAGVTQVTADRMILNVRFVGESNEVAELLKQLVNQGLPVVGFQERKLGIEDIMLKVGAKEVS